jgi:hypothetical protein
LVVVKRGTAPVARVVKPAQRTAEVRVEPSQALQTAALPEAPVAAQIV